MRLSRRRLNKARSCVGRALRLLLALAATIGVVSTPAAANDGCEMGASDKEWLTAALEQWKITATRDLKRESIALPTVYAIDAQCLFTLERGDLNAGTAKQHNGKAELPGGPTVPVGPTSFAYGSNQFVMSLPSVWRAAGVTSEFGLEQLMTGVLLHEIMHTMQSDLVTDVLEPIAEKAGVADQLSDDFLQERFEGRKAYVAAYEEERDALFAAAAAENDVIARALAAHALHLMRARHKRWLSGKNAHFAAFDGGFLTMEGAGQWLLYRYFSSLPEGQDDPDKVMDAVRRNERWWSQDQGLALMLTLDRLLPGWQQRIFSEPDWRADNLLAAAVEHQP